MTFIDVFYKYFIDNFGSKYPDFQIIKQVLNVKDRQKSIVINSFSGTKYQLSGIEEHDVNFIILSNSDANALETAYKILNDFKDRFSVEYVFNNESYVFFNFFFQKLPMQIGYNGYSHQYNLGCSIKFAKIE